MKNMELTVKARSLAAEAKIIRSLELRLKRNLKKENNDERIRLLRKQRALLHHHRTDVVRKAARSTHLARAYMSGKAYEVVERLSHTRPNCHEIARLVSKYGGERFSNTTTNAIIHWCS